MSSEITKDNALIIDNTIFLSFSLCHNFMITQSSNFPTHHRCLFLISTLDKGMDLTLHGPGIDVFHSRIVQGDSLDLDNFMNLLISGTVDFVAVILRASRHEFRQIGSLTIFFQLIRKFTQVITSREVLISRARYVEDRI